MKLRKLTSKKGNGTDREPAVLEKQNTKWGCPESQPAACERGCPKEVSKSDEEWCWVKHKAPVKKTKNNTRTKGGLRLYWKKKRKKENITPRLGCGKEKSSPLSNRNTKMKTHNPVIGKKKAMGTLSKKYQHTPRITEWDIPKGTT